MPSCRKNEDFVSALLPDYLLDVTIEWIVNNLTIDEVWNPEFILEWTANHYDPDRVFDEDKLNNWARSHGYVLEIQNI